MDLGFLPLQGLRVSRCLGRMHFSVHTRLGISPNFDSQVVKGFSFLLISRWRHLFRGNDSHVPMQACCLQRLCLGTASARSVSVKDVKHVIFSVQRIRVHALSRRESVLYFAKPGRLRQKNAFALGKRMQASFKLLRRRHWQRSRQKKRIAAQNRLLKDRL